MAKPGKEEYNQGVWNNLTVKKGLLEEIDNITQYQKF
jgi:hypothetical protein